jgi:hypothetical protein
MEEHLMTADIPKKSTILQIHILWNVKSYKDNFMNNKELRLFVSSEEFDLFNTMKNQKGIRNNTEFFRYLLTKEQERSSLTTAELFLKKFQERIEEGSYMTLRIVKAALILLYRNNLFLQDGKPEDVKELFRTKSLENVNSLYKTFEEEFKKEL